MNKKAKKVDRPKPFEFDEIEDVRIIIKAKGKHYGILPKGEIGEKVAKEIRKEVLSILIPTHYVVDGALEDLAQKNQQE